MLWQPVRGHCECSCGWGVIVDDPGKVFRGRDASHQCVNWLNKAPLADLSDAERHEFMNS